MGGREGGVKRGPQEGCKACLKHQNSEKSLRFGAVPYKF